jgi:branched-chain amino acid transport system substrate-binding protein
MTLHYMQIIKIIFISFLLCSQSFAETKPLYIGLDADMSAVAKAGGIAIQRGAEIAINEINQTGGLLGRKLELIIKDHRGNPARGLVNISEFADQEDLLAILGGVHTSVVLKELPVIHQHKLIFLDPWAAGTPIVDNGFKPNYVFRVSVRDKEAGKVFIDYAKKNGISKIALLLEQTAWGRSNEKSITEFSAKSGVEILGVQWFNWGQKSFDHELSAFNSLDIGAIIMVANAPEGADFIKDLVTQPLLLSLPIISHWGIASGDFVEKVGLDSLNKVKLSVLQTYSFERPYNQEKNDFVISRYQDLFDSSVNAKTIQAAPGVAHAYDLVHLLALAVKQAASADREAVRSELEKIKTYRGLVKTFQPPFTEQAHDALLAEDYIMSKFDKEGWLVPIK